MGKLQSSLGVPQAMIPPLFITVSLSEKSKASGRSCITVTIPLPLSESCPTKAVSVVNGKAVIDTSKCTSCGVCVGKCPFGAVPKEAASVCRIFVGGTWGKTQRMGTLLNNVYSADEVPTVIEKVIFFTRLLSIFGNEVNEMVIDAEECCGQSIQTNNKVFGVAISPAF